MSTNLPSHHFLSGKSIFVIGAGLAGSAFVASLRAAWDYSSPFPDISVFDRDPKATHERRGGYSLSLVGSDVSGGLIALNKMGLLLDVLRGSIAGVGDNGVFKLWTSGWMELMGGRRSPVRGIPTASVRISRRQIRQILLEGAQLNNEDAAYWGTQCLSVSKLPSGRLEVEMIRVGANTPRFMECDIVVVADGANSKIRSFLRPSDVLEYTGAVLRTGVSRFSGPAPREIGKNWGFVLSGNGTSFFVSPAGQGDLQWAVGHLGPKVPTEIRDVHHARLVVHQSMKLGSKIAEPFKTILSKTDPETVMCINAHDKLPFQHSEISEMPVVFIGDSNHALSPFAGYGANLGLSDAWDLAEQLAKGNSLEEAVAAYDDISYPRAKGVVTRSRKMLQSGHSTGLRYLVFVFMLLALRAFRWIFRR